MDSDDTLDLELIAAQNAQANKKNKDFQLKEKQIN